MDWCVGGGNSQYFTGSISYVLLYNRALSDAELNAEYFHLKQLSSHLIQARALDDYIRLHFGVFFSFGMETFVNTENVAGDYPVDDFAPTSPSLDLDGWLNAAVLAGAKYAVFQAKDNGGFAMWPTAYAHPYATDQRSECPTASLKPHGTRPMVRQIWWGNLFRRRARTGWLQCSISALTI